VLGSILAVMFSAFVTGALARLAIPGPDPMPIWLTILIGLVGSIVGGAIAAAISHRDPYAVSIGSFVMAVLLVAAYRRFVQKRPLTGRDALRFPERGIGVPGYRERLRRAGIHPDRPGVDGVARPPASASAEPDPDPTYEPEADAAELSPEARTEALRRLVQRRDSGEIDETEYAEERRKIVYGDA
jgi:uncharacterized membrane protein YeaQ/YmgE (transglycosylase-associated protein family)